MRGGGVEGFRSGFFLLELELEGLWGWGLRVLGRARVSGENKLVEEMEATTAAIFSFGSNEMREATKKSIGSFLTQTQICFKPRNVTIGSTPNLETTPLDLLQT